MCYFIAIEDLVANAMIAEMDKGQPNCKRFFSYSELEEFGASVISILMEDNEKAVLVLSREKTAHMLSDYADIFEEREENGVKGIGVKDNVQYERLVYEFRGYLPLKLFWAFKKAGKALQSQAIL